MQEHLRMFVFGVSLVVYGSASAIRGLVVGDPAQAGGGLFLLSVIFVSNFAEARFRKGIVRKGMSRRTERWLRPVAAAYARWRRLAAVVFVLLVCDSVIRCIVSAVDSHWGDCIFYVVTGIAAAGGLVGVTGPLAEMQDVDTPELGGLTTP